MSRIVLSVLLIFATGVLQAESSPAQAVFKKIKLLQGEWDGKDGDGKAVHSSFKSVVSGTTVMETLHVSGMEEMLSLYTIDAEGIQVSHFCPTNNQPRLRAVPSSANPKELDFQFTGAGNLPDASVGHEQRLVIQFEDADHITETWTWRHGNHDMPMVFHLARKL